MKELTYEEVLTSEIGTEVIYDCRGNNKVGIIITPQNAGNGTDELVGKIKFWNFEIERTEANCGYANIWKDTLHTHTFIN